MSYKATFSLIAIALTFLAFIPYLLSIARGQTKPHVFSWVVWGTTTFVVFLAQLEDHAGVGAWPIGLSGLITILIAFVAFLKRADISITKKDWLFFIVALSALPFGYWVANPLWAVVILTVVDLLGFAPTLRKVYHAPTSEPISFIALFLVRNIFVIMALEHYSITTVLFPAAIAIACSVLIATIVIRKQVLSA